MAPYGACPGACRVYVSVPFTRGTPPWLFLRRLHSHCELRFSPLHEGDTSVAAGRFATWPAHRPCFSPLHEGDTSVALRGVLLRCDFELVSVPFTRGTPPWLSVTDIDTPIAQRFSPLHEGDTSVALKAQACRLGDPVFQSPSRGGHLRGDP